MCRELNSAHFDAKSFSANLYLLYEKIIIHYRKFTIIATREMGLKGAFPCRISPLKKLVHKLKFLNNTL